MARMVIVSADTHAGPTARVYRDYLDPRYREDFDDVLGARANATRAGGPDDDDTERAFRSAFGGDVKARARFGTVLDEHRLARLAADGIVAEVLYPDAIGGVPFAGPFGGVGDHGRELHSAGQRAHNRWLADHVDPARQAGLGLVAYHDIEAAVRDIEWIAASPLKGILLDGVDPDLPPLDDRYYEPIWAAAADAGLPVHWHGGSGHKSWSAAMGRRTGIATSPVAIVELNFFAQRPLWFLVQGGVLERHPHLQVVFSEMGCLWSTGIAARMDWSWEHLSDGRRSSVPRPSECIERQVHFSASVMSIAEVEGRCDLGVHRLMWGSDHPHPGSAWGRTVPLLKATFGHVGVPIGDARAILAENAAALYDFDLHELHALADQVGPEPDDVLSPLPAAAMDRVVCAAAARPS